MQLRSSGFIDGAERETRKLVIAESVLVGIYER